MNIYELIKKRKSVRNYKSKVVEKEKLERILNTALLAPSAKNKQEWRFVVVSDKEKREKLSVAAKNQNSLSEAPIVIACCAETDNYEMTCGQKSYPIDLSIIIDHITLLAVGEGLGTCWIGAFHENEAKKILDIPNNVRIVELLTLGYPSDDSIKEKNRLSFDEVIKYEKWNNN
ncbi:MAG: nitroreductase family protein [Candidatus Marinimicrobia bacterium]|jgi:nitroreductase|nr:nitroreductase family protein [Candidatus Neomarinimicrobiota bacterium]